MILARPPLLTKQHVESFGRQRSRSRTVKAWSPDPCVGPAGCDYTFPMQTAQPTGRPHRNQSLFSDHYLNATLPTRPDWRGLADEARPVLDEIAVLLESYTPSENEAQVEEELVRPVLRLLGHTFEVQPALATPEGTKRPDYGAEKERV
jgi:hypothetical protein